MNALARREAAITAATAGTTRDVIEVALDLAGYPVLLADTAGLRAAGDAVEEEGVRRARARAASADLKLVLIDATRPDEAATVADLLDDDAILIANKIDLLWPGAARRRGSACPSRPAPAWTRSSRGSARRWRRVWPAAARLSPAPAIARRWRRAAPRSSGSGRRRSQSSPPRICGRRRGRWGGLPAGSMSRTCSTGSSLEFCIGK